MVEEPLALWKMRIYRMSIANKRLAAAYLALTTTFIGVAGAGPALASTAPVASAAPEAEPQLAVAPPVDFVDRPTRPLQTASSHTFTISYRNDTSAGQVVAPQILVESPDAGPFLSPSDVKIERRAPDGCWEVLPLESQTGTLFTDLSAAQRILHPAGTLVERFRVTVITSNAQGVVHPRLALYG
ncbi:signal peptide protein [Streptomyces sp. NPDC004539]|uniref:signal peptide protein n=1 Tax=Streptomyces sp. NPDC004539 TaxID=3154280 RepID=UPI0033A17FEB